VKDEDLEEEIGGKRSYEDFFEEVESTKGLGLLEEYCKKFVKLC